MFWFVAGLIFVALAFDYINGFHDAANSIATVVSTRVLSPGKAVIWAAFFNFVAAFTFGTAVAKTVGSGMVDVKIVTFSVIFAGLTGAIVWDLITWYYGLPTSSSHALIGGYAGAAVAKAGMAAIIASGWTKTILFIFLSPLIGLVLGFGIMTSIMWIFRWMPPSRVDRWFRRLQLVSAAAFSLNHGANDAQKTMGIIAGVLFAAHYIDSFYIPFWVVLTGTPVCVAMRMEIAALVSAAKPPTGWSLVIFDPIVWMMRQPPASVPSPIAACAASTTQNGM